MTIRRNLLLWAPARDEALERALAALDVTLSVARDAPEAMARLADAEGVILSAALVSNDWLETLATAAPRLRWIHLTSAGYDNIVGRALPEGLVITYTPGAGATTVAEHGMGLMLALARRLPAAFANQRDAQWDYGVGARAVSLQGRTALIIGFGHIGKAFAPLARAFGMKVVAASRNGAPSDLADASCRIADIDKHLPRADFVVVAAPLTRETRGLLGEDRLALMGAHAFLINLSRGPIVDATALARRLHDGGLAGAALDVTEPEPLPRGHPLWWAPNIILTPHIAAAGSTPGDSAHLVTLTVENARRFSLYEPLLHIVDSRADEAA